MTDTQIVGDNLTRLLAIEQAAIDVVMARHADQIDKANLRLHKIVTHRCTIPISAEERAAAWKNDKLKAFIEALPTGAPSNV